MVDKPHLISVINSKQLNGEGTGPALQNVLPFSRPLLSCTAGILLLLRYSLSTLVLFNGLKVDSFFLATARGDFPFLLGVCTLDLSGTSSATATVAIIPNTIDSD